MRALNRIFTSWRGWVVPALLLALWEYTSHRDAAHAYAFVPLEQVLGALGERLSNGDLLHNLVGSLERTSLGLVIGVLLGIGVGNSKAATNSVHFSKFEYNIAGGVDYSFSSHVDWRVIEIGYGSVETISTGAISATGNTSSSRMVNFSTGLVFRIP